MIKIAYLYNENEQYIEQLKECDPTLLVNNTKDAENLIKYNLKIKNIKYDGDCYDIVISDNDDFYNIMALKKVAIGDFKQHKNKICYFKTLDLKEILKKPEKQDIKFSIIVPNYNNGDWIAKTIESVINQTYKNWEMYIIDDMSTDNSINVITKYKDDRITFIQNEIKLYNGGSRNIGILKAKKSNPDGYLLFIDSDDWLANDKVLDNLNKFIENEDVITLDYQYYMDGQIRTAGKHKYQNKDELFMTIGAMCAVWCKCFKVSVAPLFEFNTLMEDRNYHYRLINRAQSYANFGQVTHTWNKMNIKSITSKKDQVYDSSLQAKIEWDNCAYRHIAGMLDLLNELNNPRYIQFIKDKIEACKRKVQSDIFEQF